MGLAGQGTEFIRRHTWLEHRDHLPVDLDGDVGRLLHEGDFGLRFDETAFDRHRVCTHVLEVGGLGTNTVIEEEANALLHSDAARSDAEVCEKIRHDPAGVFVLLPGSNVGAEPDLLDRLRLLELGQDVDGLAFNRQHGGKHPLARPHADIGEVLHARAHVEVDGVDSCSGHQPLSLLDPPPPLFIRNRRNVLGHRHEVVEDSRLRSRLLRTARTRDARTNRRTNRCLEKVSPPNAHRAPPSFRRGSL